MSPFSPLGLNHSNRREIFSKEAGLVLKLTRGNGCRIGNLCILSLEVDLLSESCIQLHLKLLHLISDGPQLVLELARLLVHSRRCRFEQFLCILERQVEVRVADFVSVTTRIPSRFVSLYIGITGPADLAHCIFSSSSASSSSVLRSSSSSFSFYWGAALADCNDFVSGRNTYSLVGKLFLQDELSLMKSAEFVDLVLVLSANLDLITARLFCFGQLEPTCQNWW